jgi:hypothetical protein
MNVFLTYFDAPAALTLAQLVAWHDGGGRAVGAGGGAGAGGSGGSGGSGDGGSSDGSGGSGGYGHLFRAHVPVFDHIFDNDGAFGGGRGGFFAALRARPEAYLARRCRLGARLRALRASGVARPFLATNSHPRFARFVLRFTLGPRWRECFDVVFFACAKPAWFARAQPLLEAAPAGQEAAAAAAAAAAAPAPPPAASSAAPHAPPPAVGRAVGALEFRVPAEGAAAASAAAAAALPPAVEFSAGCADALEAAMRQHAAWRGARRAAGLTCGEWAAHVPLGADGAPLQPPAGAGGEGAGGEAAAGAPAEGPVHVFYAGDHLHGDVAAAAARGWQAVAVVEEAGAAFKGAAAANPFWHDFFAHAGEEDGSVSTSHWAQLLSTHASQTVEDVEEMFQGLQTFGSS